MKLRIRPKVTEDQSIKAKKAEAQRERDTVYKHSKELNIDANYLSQRNFLSTGGGGGLAGHDSGESKLDFFSPPSQYISFALKIYFKLQRGEHSNKLLRQDVESPPSEILKTLLATVLSSSLQLTLLWAWGLD